MNTFVFNEFVLKNVKSLWEELEFEMKFCEVTIACEEKQIKAQEVVMPCPLSVLINFRGKHIFIFLNLEDILN